MPQTGEQILFVCITKGKLQITQEGTVAPREKFDLTSSEFATTLCQRYPMSYFWPGGEPCYADHQRRPDDPLWLYTTSHGKLGAIDRLKADYVRSCIQAESKLQEQARTLHEYASQAQQIKI